MQEFGKAGKEGVLVKGANYLDIITKSKTIVLDKTGTITKGTFEVTKTIPQDGIEDKEVLKIAKIAESLSNHPIAQSIMRKVKFDIDKNKISDYLEDAGMGIKLKYENDEILAGNEKLLDKENIIYSKCNEEDTIVYVVKNNKFLGVIIISDEVKEDSKEAIKNFKDNGINNIYMLTGDNKETAENVAKNVEIENIYYNLLPNEKVEKMKQIKNENGYVISIGDGINDSPLLALADVGIAVGNTGSDLAIETSDAVIMDGKLSSVNKLIKTSKKTKRIVMENIYFAIGIKVIVLLLGALGISTMWGAVFADVGVTFITVLNSLRIFRR